MDSSRGDAANARTVVFVCEHGTAKSVIAMAYFDRLAREAGLPFRAMSRGTTPDAALPAFVRDGLQRDGFDLGAFIPRPLSHEDLDGADVVVSLGAPDFSALTQRPVVRWDGLPAVSVDYHAGRDAIRQRVEALIDAVVRSGGDR